MKKNIMVLVTLSLLFSCVYVPVLAATEFLELSTLTLYQKREINIEGIKNNSNFPGGIFHLKPHINFADLFKDGETNGLVSA